MLREEFSVSPLVLVRKEFPYHLPAAFLLFCLQCICFCFFLKAFFVPFSGCCVFSLHGLFLLFSGSISSCFLTVPERCLLGVSRLFLFFSGLSIYAFFPQIKAGMYQKRGEVKVFLKSAQTGDGSVSNRPLSSQHQSAVEFYQKSLYITNLLFCLMILLHTENHNTKGENCSIFTSMIQGILSGRSVDMEEIEAAFTNQKMVGTIRRYLEKPSDH